MKYLNAKMTISLGLALRFLICFWSGNPIDFETFIRVGYYVNYGVSPTSSRLPYITGLGQPTYPYLSGLGYLSGWGLLTAISYKIYSLFPYSRFIYYLLLKIFPILGDIGSSYIIYKLSIQLNYPKSQAKKMAINFFLCPIVIIISSLWGMFDSICVFLILLSIYLLIKKEIILSSIILAIGTYFKMISIIFLPMYIIYLYELRNLNDVIKYMSTFIESFMFLALTPLIIFKWSLSEAVITILSQTERLGGVLTIFNILSLLNSLFNEFFSTSFMKSFYLFPLVRYLWVLGVLIAILIFMKILNQEPNNCKKIIMGCMFSILLFLLTRTFIAEQYVMYLLPFLILLDKKKLYEDIWKLAVIFLFINFYPFTFAYLLNVNLWKIFVKLNQTTPIMHIRLLLRSIIAFIFDYILIFNIYKEVKKHV